MTENGKQLYKLLEKNPLLVFSHTAAKMIAKKAAVLVRKKMLCGKTLHRVAWLVKMALI